MNKKLAIGLIVGGVLIIGMGSYLIYKRKKSQSQKKSGDKKIDDKKVDDKKVDDKGASLGTGTGDVSTNVATDTKTTDTKTTDTKTTDTKTTDVKTETGSGTNIVSGSGSNVSTTNETTTALKEAYDNLSFESGKDVIKATSLNSLNELADVLKKSVWGLKLEGHTDNTGDANWNLTLSKRRADAVKKYLVGKGIEASRITTEGFGITRPIADNKTAEGRTKNRRVEFKIVK